MPKLTQNSLLAFYLRIRNTIGKITSFILAQMAKVSFEVAAGARPSKKVHCSSTSDELNIDAFFMVVSYFAGVIATVHLIGLTEHLINPDHSFIQLPGTICIIVILYSTMVSVAYLVRRMTLVLIDAFLTRYFRLPEGQKVKLKNGDIIKSGRLVKADQD